MIDSRREGGGCPQVSCSGSERQRVAQYTRTQEKVSNPVPGCASDGRVCVSISGSRRRHESDLGQGPVMRNISVTQAIHNGALERGG